MIRMEEAKEVSNHLRNGTSATSSAATVQRIWCTGRHLANLYEHHIVEVFVIWPIYMILITT